MLDLEQALDTVQAGQSEIYKYRVVDILLSRIDTTFARGFDIDRVTKQFQSLAQAIGKISVVIDD